MIGMRKFLWQFDRSPVRNCDGGSNANNLLAPNQRKEYNKAKSNFIEQPLSLAVIQQLINHARNIATLPSWGFIQFLAIGGAMDNVCDTCSPYPGRANVNGGGPFMYSHVVADLQQYTENIPGNPPEYYYCC